MLLVVLVDVLWSPVTAILLFQLVMVNVRVSAMIQCFIFQFYLIQYLNVIYTVLEDTST